MVSYGQVQMICWTITILMCGLKVMRSQSIKKKNENSQGSSRWATEQEIKRAGLWQKGKGVILGWVKNKSGWRHEDKKLLQSTDSHVLVCAPTRTGKGVGVVIPTLLSTIESVFVVDIKGENFEKTAGYRSQVLKQKVYKFSPTQEGSSCYNPLLEIREGREDVKDAQNVSRMIIDCDGKGLDDHWKRSAFSLLTGLILHIIYFEERHKKNLYQLATLLTKEDDLEEVFNKIKETDHSLRKKEDCYFRKGCHPIVHSSMNEILQKSEQERSGVISTLLSYLSVYKDPQLAQITSHSSWNWKDFLYGKEAMSIYICVSPIDFLRIKPLIRLMINQVCHQLTESLNEERKRDLLLMLDEFANLGKLESIQSGLTYMAGYGVRMCLIVQDLGQIERLYGQGESITGNTQIQIYFAPTQLKTAEELSKRLGKETLWNYSEGESYSSSLTGGKQGHLSEGKSQTGRPLLTADEIMRLNKQQAIIFVNGEYPILANKLIYYKEREWVVKSQIHPVFEKSEERKKEEFEREREEKTNEQPVI